VPTWGQIERELLESRQGDGPPDWDKVRRKYLALLAHYSRRNVIVYETAGFAPPQPVSPDAVQIVLEPDLAAFMECVHGLPVDVPLDLVLHSPGGTAEAAEAIVEYLRGRFPGIRVIVPVAAMSAATMIALAADSIVMGSHPRSVRLILSCKS
jgi:ClpP class serine protease